MRELASALAEVGVRMKERRRGTNFEGRGTRTGRGKGTLRGLLLRDVASWRRRGRETYLSRLRWACLKKTNNAGESMFDARLFNQSKGMDTGFGDDETYGVYDKPWRKEGDTASNIYRPSKNIDSEMYGGKEDLEALRSNKRFVADKGFQGTEGGAAGGSSRAGPVQFEKETDDPFGLDDFLHKAKQASSNKRKDDDGRERRDDRGREDRKRRKEYD